MYVHGADLTHIDTETGYFRVLFNVVKEHADGVTLDIKYQVPSDDGLVMMEERFVFDDRYTTVKVSSRPQTVDGVDVSWSHGWSTATEWKYADAQVAPQQMPNEIRSP